MLRYDRERTVIMGGEMIEDARFISHLGSLSMSGHDMIGIMTI
jgi:hypothetical protein